MNRAVASALVIVLLGAATCRAEEWARKMFEGGLTHDFGTVARGAKVEYEFRFKNLYLEDVHVASVTSSCGCASPEVTQDTLKTYEEAAIVASFNTRAFLGQKSATITVTFDKPFYAQVQLQVSGYIRSDVVLHPGSVEFGTVDMGTGGERKVTVSYAGRNDWQIIEVKSSSPYLGGAVVETGRSGGQVTYELQVHLKEGAPVGYLNETLVLVTNDRRSVEVPVPVEAHICSAITVSPATLFLGVLEPGQKVIKQLVVKGKEPFRIESITCDGGDFTFHAADASKPVHLVPVAFTAGQEPGRVTFQIHIETDLAEQRACEIVAHAQVVASRANAAK